MTCYFNGKVKCCSPAQKALAEASAKKNKAHEQTQTDKNLNKPKKLTFKEQKELDTIEDTILEAESEKESIEQAIADPETYKIPGKAKELSDKLHETERTIDALYARWEYLQNVRDGRIPSA